MFSKTCICSFTAETSAGCSTVIKPRNGVSALALFLFCFFFWVLLTSFVAVTHQATIAERLRHGLHIITGNSKNLLARRPFFVFWFMGQIRRYDQFQKHKKLILF